MWKAANQLSLRGWAGVSSVPKDLNESGGISAKRTFKRGTESTCKDLETEDESRGHLDS